MRQKILTDDKLQNLSSLLAAVSESQENNSEFAASASIHFLRNYTTETIDPYLQFFLLRNEIEPCISHGGYGTILQEVLDPNSSLVRQSPDFLVLSLVLDVFDPACRAGNWRSADAATQFSQIIATLLERSSAQIIINTFLPPVEVCQQSVNDWSGSKELQALNQHVAALQAAHEDRLKIVDFNSVMKRAGPENSIDVRFWRSSQAPFKKGFLIDYARAIVRSVRAQKLISKKCVILDCDNTLWGGVIGEDGMAGIQLHNDEIPGRYFYEFQRAAVRLNQQGIILALCSKNNERDVWDVLEKHPFCVLEKPHVAAFRINWANKAENIVSLADELNIGLDSMVFVDDSPQERALIQELVPEVTVLSVPDDLTDYPGILERDGLFESQVNTIEDRSRSKMYQQQAQRKEEMGSHANLEEYLRSLCTVARISIVGDDAAPRVAQLTQKTNQFNLTTRRYTQAEIGRFIADPNYRVISMSVCDKFGDMGLTGVFIARNENDVAVVDSYLLSCRVLGRQLEFAFIEACIAKTEQDFAPASWRAEYRVTRKNEQVADFWDQVGFVRADRDGETFTYVKDVGTQSVDYSSIITVIVE